ncbi:P-loop containing nucleoside triphosphate hydrolase protein [Phyllosticta citribraziliensis]|uniref:P-loop containing nucleoside triphosphate hydrolase protein n=1 Tax=Phyllosticta citribraziliensis TaxID=989973 RepID=A0ABR1LUC2_9PEZI
MAYRTALEYRAKASGQKRTYSCVLAIASCADSQPSLVVGNGLEHEAAVRQRKEGKVMLEPPPARESKVATYITVANFDGFDSYIELSMDFVEAQGVQSFQSSTAATIRLTHDSIANASDQPALVEWCKVTGDTKETVLKLFGFSGEVVQSYMNAAVLKGCSLYLVTVPFSPNPPSGNLMGTSAPHESVFEVFNRTKAAFSKHGSVHILISEMLMDEKLERLNNRLHQYRLQDPLASFYNAVGQLLQKSTRPPIFTGKQVVFSSWQHYRTLFNCAIAEEIEVLGKQSQALQGAMHLISVPNTGNTQFLGILNHNAAAYRLSEGDTLLVRVNCNNEEDEQSEGILWTAKVTSRIPFAPSNSTSVILYRGYSDENGHYDSAEIAYLPMETMLSLQESQRALLDAIPVPVLYTLGADQPWTRITDSMTEFEECSGLGWAKAALLGRSISNESTVDLFEGIEHDMQASCAMELVESRLNPGQVAAVTMTRSLPSGIGIVQGPPGTGKTFTIANLVQPLIFNSKPHKGPKVLILSTSNLSVDDITMRVQSTCAVFANELSARRTPVVVRVHARHTESSIVTREADLSRPSHRPSSSGLSSSQIEDQSPSAKALTGVYRRAIHKPFGVGDKRLRLLDNSLGSFILAIAALPRDELKGNERSVVSCFRQIYSRYKEGKLGDEEMVTFQAAQKALRDVALARTDILVMTLSNAGDSELAKSINPKVIIVDEAARASDPDLWPIFAWYSQSTTRLLVGDSRQLQPVAEYNNPLREHLSHSAMTRLQSLGYPHVQLIEQRRSASAIASVYNKPYYGDAIETPEGLDEEFREHTAPFERFLREVHHIECPQPAVQFDLAHGESRFDASGSSYNLTSVRVTMQVISDLYTYGIDPSRVAVLTPYASQVSQYIAAKAEMSEQNEGFSDLMIETFDSIQGREFDYTIVDFVRSDKLGFLSEGNRINVALSRARFGMIVMMDRRLPLTKGWRPSGLYDVSRVLKKTRRSAVYFDEPKVLKLPEFEHV